MGVKIYSRADNFAKDKEAEVAGEATRTLGTQASRDER